MSKRIHLNEETINKIITDHFLFGKSDSSIARELNCSQSTVSRVTSTFSLLRDGKIDELAEKVRGINFAGNVIIKIIAARIGMEIPEEIRQAMEDRKTNRAERMRAQKKPRPVENKKEEPAPKVVQATQETNGHNETLYFCRILEELHKHNELMEQLMDVVIPKYIADLKDNLNINFDTVTQSLKRAEDTLEGIKINTRKRGI